jgi:cyclophilin family peptidyl-prolyl cis-trans isomerase
MTVAVRPQGWSMARLLLVGLLLGVGLAGCKKVKAPRPSAQEAKAEAPDSSPEARWKQSFAEATRAEAMPDWTPPETTLTGKSVGKVYEEVKKAWPATTLSGESGKLLAFSAILETDQGTVEIALRPDWAPNHVRNFLALAQAGYYDGLVFDHIHREVSESNPAEKLEMVEAGCPLGTGDTGSGSIGYWLKPEFDAKVHHEEGTVGAFHEQEKDTAATRFYITLTKAPLLDGNFTVFGKVTRGLDIARKIFEQPTQSDDGNASGSYRPLKPVVIRKVTIQSKEVDSQG